MVFFGNTLVKSHRLNVHEHGIGVVEVLLINSFYHFAAGGWWFLETGMYLGYDR
jgi:hypothetical protein